MYVLFESKKVLNCYSLDGQYLHSYSFDMRKNGQSHLYVKGGHLYLESREHFFYRFKNGIFVDVHVPASSQIYTLRAELAAGSHSHRITNGEYMELRGASIWRTGESVHEEIIHRPLWLLIFQGNIQIYIFLLCMLSIVFLNFRYVKHFCSISPFAFNKGAFAFCIGLLACYGEVQVLCRENTIIVGDKGKAQLALFAFKQA